MLAALGSLASWGLPKLLTFASKKLLHTNIGKAASKVIQSPLGKNVIQNVGRNYNKMMSGNYN